MLYLAIDQHSKQLTVNVRDESGQPHLMELELVEPRLFLAHPPALEALASAIVRRI